ncbi:serine threonine- kinase EDR1-like [Olea europaea subsp. europaea]|uniref:Serine threonine- kinase EDR1-like n=1 Tax=Olea europaea subsp. europaea TaxID=158383 RepID=A0A8S0PDT5_OLEEU|nr:serine threonine- kinase EDR1-like [Olea europaea subsp. europaea]
MISLSSSEETSNSNGLKTEYDLGSSAFQRASQTLWDTGKLDEPIPDCFYFVTPERRFKEPFDSIPSSDELYIFGEGFMLNVLVANACEDKKLSILKQVAATLVKGLSSSPTALIKKIAGLVQSPGL